MKTSFIENLIITIIAIVAVICPLGMLWYALYKWDVDFEVFIATTLVYGFIWFAIIYLIRRKYDK